MGLCTVGGVYVLVMSDEMIIVKGMGMIFIGGLLFVKVVIG